MRSAQEPFWRFVAVAALLAVGGLVGLEAVDRFRVWSREDAKGRQSAEEARSEAEREAEVQRQTAEVARECEERVRWVKDQNKQHPERFRSFRPMEDEVRVLSSSPQKGLRGLRGLVLSRNSVQDPDSRTTWKWTYDIQILPMTGEGQLMTLDFQRVDAEHLAKVGSNLETKDLRENPSLTRVAINQDARIVSADRWLQELASIPSFSEGDPVVIRETDPRPALRGRKGKLVSILPSQPVFGSVASMELPTCEVWLDTEPGIEGLKASTSGIVRVNITHLKLASR